ILCHPRGSQSGSSFRWVSCSGGVDAATLRKQGLVPFPAGMDKFGGELYPATTFWEGGVILGKCTPSLDKIYFPYGGIENTKESDFWVFCVERGKGRGQ